MEFSKVFKNVYTYIFLLIIVFSVYVRAEGIGYSGFQGDEVATIDFLYQASNGIWQYLLDQKKGPIQFVINIINASIFGYHNEFQIRLPYLFFGVGAIYSFYLLSKRIFDKNIALLTALLMSINGLFIAFARITQYQSLMYFVIPFGMVLFIDAYKSNSNKKYMWSGFVMSFCLLTHYDTLSTIPFFVGILLSSFIKRSSGRLSKKLIISHLKSAFIFFSTFLLPPLLFYIPFYLGNAFKDTTSTYLDNRLFGGGFMPRTEIVLKIITLYIPEFHIYFLFISAVLFLALLSVKMDDINLKFIVLKKQVVTNIYISLCLLLLFSSLFSLYPIKPRSATILVLISSIAICGLILLSKKVRSLQAGLICWFLGTYAFYFYIMKDPRTHVYVSFIPLFFLSSAGIINFLRIIKLDFLKHIILISFTGMVLFICCVNYLIYVDKNPEYPWTDKSLLGYEIYKLKKQRYEKIDGVFGFNNYRGWEKLADYYKRGCLIGDFKSNEKDSITYFYTRRHQVPIEGDFAVSDNLTNLVIVNGPHSWNYVSPQFFEGFVLLTTIKSFDYDVTYIYGRESAYPDKKMLCD